MAAKATRKPWEIDATDGHGKSSMSVLLGWLTQPGNYARWRAGRTNGQSKASMITEIVLLLHENGLTHRHYHDVRSKMNHLMHSFQDAVEWRNGAGMRALEAGDDIDMNAELRKRCKFYEALAPIMLEHPSSPPVRASEDQILEKRSELRTTEAAPANKRPAAATSTETANIQATDRTSETRATPSKRARISRPSQWIQLSNSDPVIEDEALERHTKRPNIEVENAKIDLRLREIQVLKELGLARKALIDAGVASDEINRLLPLP